MSQNVSVLNFSGNFWGGLVTEQDQGKEQRTSRRVIHHGDNCFISPQATIEGGGGVSWGCVCGLGVGWLIIELPINLSCIHK